MKFKTGDRVRALDHRAVGEDFRGLEGAIVAFSPGADDEFFINFDTPPADYYHSGRGDAIHQGGKWHAHLVELIEPEPTIQEIADLFGMDPHDVAVSALENS